MGQHSPGNSHCRCSFPPICCWISSPPFALVCGTPPPSSTRRTASPLLAAKYDPHTSTRTHLHAAAPAGPGRSPRGGLPTGPQSPPPRDDAETEDDDDGGRGPRSRAGACASELQGLVQQARGRGSGGCSRRHSRHGGHSRRHSRRGNKGHSRRGDRGHSRRHSRRDDRGLEAQGGRSQRHSRRGVAVVRARLPIAGAARDGR